MKYYSDFYKYEYMLILFKSTMARFKMMMTKTTRTTSAADFRLPPAACATSKCRRRRCRRRERRETGTKREMRRPSRPRWYARRRARAASR